MAKRKIAILGIGSGWGAADGRAANGPQVILSRISRKYPHIPVFYAYYHDNPSTINRDISHSSPRIRRNQIQFVLQDVYDKVQDLRRQGYFIVILSGDHTYALSIQAALYERSSPPRSLIYIDAHMDANTPRTSPSKNPHGMPVAAILGHGGYPEWRTFMKHPIRPENFYQYGIRSFDNAEERFLLTSGANIYKIEDCQELGIGVCLGDAVSRCGDKPYSVSIDVDAFDPHWIPGTGYREPNGLNPKDVLEFLHHVGHDTKCMAVEITEYNPQKDRGDKSLHWILRFLDQLLQ